MIARSLLPLSVAASGHCHNARASVADNQFPSRTPSFFTPLTRRIPAGSLFGMFVGFALSMGALLWVLYVAVEPYVRRRWPHTLITWTRLLSGEFRDPLVGRDILIGCAGGMVLNLERHGRALITTDVFSSIPMALNGLAGWISQLCSIGTSSIIGGLFSLFLIFSFRLITRSDTATM